MYAQKPHLATLEHACLHTMKIKNLRTVNNVKGVPLTSHWLGQASATDATTTAGLLRTCMPSMEAVTVYVPAAWAW